MISHNSTHTCFASHLVSKIVILAFPEIQLQMNIQGPASSFSYFRTQVRGIYEYIVSNLGSYSPHDIDVPRYQLQFLLTVTGHGI